MASTSGWNPPTVNDTGLIGDDQSLNNSSGFNATLMVNGREARSV